MTETTFDARTYDLEYHAPTKLNAAQRWFLPMLRDERDLIFVNTSARLTFGVVLPALILFVPGAFSWLYAGLYLVWLALFGFGPYVLMLHCTSHRTLFKREHDRWNKYIPWVLGPFFGQTPESYYVHHMGMHHAEDNLEGDLSSTMPYQRDKFSHWLHYWARFFWFAYLHFPKYLAARNKGKLWQRFKRGEQAWALLVFIAVMINWKAALVVFVAPLMLIRTFFMSGNWAQHAFVDIDDPNNPYRHSNNLINHRYNRRCFNDGYHIVHHISATCHWSEMPAAYYDNWEKYAEQDAIVFDGLGNNQTLWWCLMTHQWERLANHMVVFPGRERTVEERIAFLQGRARASRGAFPSLLVAAKELPPPPTPWRWPTEAK
jgi:fatty acid desaturase